MGIRRKRYSAKSEELRMIIAGYETSGQTRAEYAATVGLSVNTLDYYRRRLRSSPQKPRLFEVEQIVGGGRLLYPKQSCQVRIEVGGGRALGFDSLQMEQLAVQGAHLQRLIRLVEEA